MEAPGTEVFFGGGVQPTRGSRDTIAPAGSRRRAHSGGQRSKAPENRSFCLCGVQLGNEIGGERKRSGKGRAGRGREVTGQWAREEM